MIQFYFEGHPYPSFDQQKEVKEAFIKKLGPFKEEFSKKDGIVTFDFSICENDNQRCRFQIAEKYDLADFIIRWNEYLDKNT